MSKFPNTSKGGGPRKSERFQLNKKRDPRKNLGDRKKKGGPRRFPA